MLKPVLSKVCVQYHLQACEHIDGSWLFLSMNLHTRHRAVVQHKLIGLLILSFMWLYFHHLIKLSVSPPPQILQSLDCIHYIMWMSTDMDVNCNMTCARRHATARWLLSLQHYNSSWNDEWLKQQKLDLQLVIFEVLFKVFLSSFSNVDAFIIFFSYIYNLNIFSFCNIGCHHRLQEVDEDIVNICWLNN